MGQGGRPALHAETASRGSEPVASPTGSEKIRLGSTKICQRVEGFDAFEGGPRVEAVRARPRRWRDRPERNRTDQDVNQGQGPTKPAVLTKVPPRASPRPALAALRPHRDGQRSTRLWPSTRRGFAPSSATTFRPRPTSLRSVIQTAIPASGSSSNGRSCTCRSASARPPGGRQDLRRLPNGSMPRPSR